LQIIQLKPNKAHDYFHIYAHKVQDYSLINQEITVKRFYYDVGNDSNYLTEKEMQCLCLLIRQKTFKEVGKLLKISPKTVDNHVEHMKHKTNTNSVRELCDFFRHNLLFNAALKL
jgi:DNA-binding CsgD family transcriptional regulator